MTTPLLQLVDSISAAFAEEKAQGFVIDNSQPEESFCRLDRNVRDLISEYIDAGHADWKQYCHFNSDHYLRNLVYGNEDFELMVICWDKGQASRIHDHQNAHGWVTVLDGTVQEKRYRPSSKVPSKDSVPISPPHELLGVIAACTPCPKLDELGTVLAKRGAAALYINDHIALHAVACAPGSTEPAVTLHLYSPPVRRVQLFEPEGNRVVERTPGFFSVGGERI